MPFEVGIEYIIQMIKSRNDEQIYERWLHGYHMQMSFEEFKDKLGVMPEMVEDDRTAVEVVDDVIAMLGV